MMTLINLAQVKEILNITTPFEIPNFKRLGLLTVVKKVDGVEMFDEDKVRELAFKEKVKSERLSQLKAEQKKFDDDLKQNPSMEEKERIARLKQIRASWKQYEDEQEKN
jgi:hypothetical protein